MPRKVNADKTTHAKDEPVAEAEEDVPLAQLAYHIMHDEQRGSPPASRSTSPVHSDTEPNEQTATTSPTQARNTNSNAVDELSLVTARAVAHIFGWQLKRAAPLPRRRSSSLQDRQTMRFALRHRQSHKTLTVEIKPRSRQDTHMSLVTINGEPMWPKQAALRLMKETKVGFATGAGADSQANTSISVASAASVTMSGEESINNTPLHPAAAAPLLVNTSSTAGSEPALVRLKAVKRPRSPSPTPIKEEENKGTAAQKEEVGGIIVVAEEHYSEVRLRSEASVSASAPLVAEEHITCNTSEAFIMEVTPAAAATSSPLPQLPPPSSRKAKTASKSTPTVAVPPSNARMTGKSASPSHTKGSSNTRHTTTPPPLPSHHKHHSHHKQHSSPSSSPTASSSLYRYVGHGLQPLAQATLCDGYSSTTMVDILAHSRALLRSCGYALAQSNGSKKSSGQGETSEAALLDAILHEDYNTVDVFSYCEQGENVRERMRQGLYTAVAAGRLSGDALHAGVQALQQCEDEERRYFLPNTRSMTVERDACSELDHTTSNCLPLCFPRTVPPTFLPVSGAALLEVQYRLNALTRPTHLLPSASISAAAADNSPIGATSLTCCTPPSSAKEGQLRYEIHAEGIVPAPRIAITHTYHLRGTRRVQLPCPPNSIHWRTTNTIASKCNGETTEEDSDTHSVLPVMGMNPEADLMLYVHTRFMTPSVRAMLLASANVTPDTTTSTTGNGSGAVAKPETTEDNNNNATGNTPATRDIDKLLRRAENIQPIPMPDLEWYYGTL